MSTGACRTILCNSAGKPRSGGEVLRLEYLEGKGITPNVRVGLPKFVRGIYHLPDRLLDLLEIACFVFAADRKISRGPNDAVEFHSWSRDLCFDIRVRDFGFWNQQEVKDLLSESLTFMTGDATYSFNFRSGHSTDQADFFDSEEFHITIDRPTRIWTFFWRSRFTLRGFINLKRNRG